MPGSRTLQVRPIETHHGPPQHFPAPKIQQPPPEFPSASALRHPSSGPYLRSAKISSSNFAATSKIDGFGLVGRSNSTLLLTDDDPLMTNPIAAFRSTMDTSRVTNHPDTKPNIQNTASFPVSRQSLRSPTNPHVGKPKLQVQNANLHSTNSSSFHRKRNCISEAQSCHQQQQPCSRGKQSCP